MSRIEARNEIALAQAKVDAVAAKYPQLAALGAKAVAALGAGGFGRSMDAAVAREVLGSIDEVVKSLGLTVNAPVATITTVAGSDTAALLAALGKSPDVRVTSMGGDDFKTLGSALVDLVNGGQAAGAARILVNFLKADLDIVAPRGLSYFAGNWIEGLKSTVREALEENGVNPDALGVPQSGPIAM